jgi:hypothetical protein
MPALAIRAHAARQFGKLGHVTRADHCEGNPMCGESEGVGYLPSVFWGITRI